MATIIMYGNIKGGTGKTTITFETGYCLSVKRKKVLLIDLDSQCNLTAISGIENEIIKNHTIYDCMMGGCAFRDAIQEIRKDLYIIPGSRKMLSQYFVGAEDIYLLKEAMEYIGQVGIPFDYILIDNGPESGNLLKMSMLCSDYVILVTQPTELGYAGGLQMCADLRTGERMYKDFHLKPLGIIVNNVRKTNVANANIEKFINLQSEFAPLFKTMIKQSAVADEAKEFAKAINEYSPSSQMAKDFKQLTGEIERRIAHV